MNAYFIEIDKMLSSYKLNGSIQYKKGQREFVKKNKIEKKKKKTANIWLKLRIFYKIRISLVVFNHLKWNLSKELLAQPCTTSTFTSILFLHFLSSHKWLMTRIRMYSMKINQKPINILYFAMFIVCALQKQAKIEIKNISTFRSFVWMIVGRFFVSLSTCLLYSVFSVSLR